MTTASIETIEKKKTQHGKLLHSSRGSWLAYPPLNCCVHVSLCLGNNFSCRAGGRHYDDCCSRAAVGEKIGSQAHTPLTCTVESRNKRPPPPLSVASTYTPNELRDMGADDRKGVCVRLSVHKFSLYDHRVHVPPSVSLSRIWFRRGV